MGQVVNCVVFLLINTTRQMLAFSGGNLGSPFKYRAASQTSIIILCGGVGLKGPSTSNEAHCVPMLVG